MAVKSDHFLVRLLQSITVPKSQPTTRYYENVSAISLNLSMALKLTSSIYPGHVFKGVFYGTGTTEILIAHDESFDPVEADKNWKNLCPVRVLRHPRSDLGLNLPDGHATGSETGLAVIAINITMLAIQYRGFRNEETKIAEVTHENQRSIMQFIHMYVLPNMVLSQTDVALINRVLRHVEGAPLGESYKGHSFFLSDYTKKTDDVIEVVIENLRKTKRTFTGILRNIPVITKDTAETVMNIPDMAPTKQVVWALATAVLPEIKLMLLLSEENAKNRNQQEINKILRAILKYENNNFFESVLPRDTLYEVSKEIQEIVGIIEHAER